MVSASKCLRSPVVTLFSSSPALSRAAQEVLKDLFSLEPFFLRPQMDDELDQVLNIPMWRRGWDSVASKCPSSGAVLHLLSLTSANGSASVASANEDLSLVGITNAGCNLQSDECAVVEARRLLASHLNDDRRSQSAIKSFRLVFKHATDRPIHASDIVGFGSGLPILDLSVSKDFGRGAMRSNQNHRGGMKEVAIPFFDGGAYPDGRSLLSLLGSSALSRPTVGVYQWPENGNCLAIRPLPSAREDLSLPIPSIVFYCDNLDHAAKHVSSLGATSAKIGYNGLNKHGQLMVSHSSLPGLDIRLTDNVEFASAFPEAQDALLASSVDELQSANVIVEGGKGGGAPVRDTADDRVNGGDCWMEFRANMKRPSGFLKKRRGTTERGVKTAKAPDLPYE